MSSFLNFFRSNSSNSINIEKPNNNINVLGSNMEQHRSLSASTELAFTRTPSMEIPQKDNNESSYYRMLQVVEGGSLFYCTNSNSDSSNNSSRPSNSTIVYHNIPKNRFNDFSFNKENLVDTSVALNRNTSLDYLTQTIDDHQKLKINNNDDEDHDGDLVDFVKRNYQRQQQQQQIKQKTKQIQIHFQGEDFTFDIAYYKFNDFRIDFIIKEFCKRYPEKVSSTSNTTQQQQQQFICKVDGEIIPQHFKVLNFKSENLKFYLYKKLYAFDRTDKSFKSILENLIQEKIVHSLTDQQLSDCIDLFENELAILSPKTLTELKSSLKSAKEIIGPLKNFIHEYKGRLEVNNENDIRIKLADLKHPHNWFPQARKIKRTFILHVGPTNSGKTFNAMQALTQSESGIYCGPLRLLAHEIYDKIKAENIPCSLITGQLKEIDSDAQHISCTIETCPTETFVQTAVIDEFQMIGDVQRGWAWTRAILGVPALEVHLCGDNTAVDLIEKICKITGDNLIIKNYERMNPLIVESNSVKMTKLQKGDCLVSFSRQKILDYKEKLDKMGHKCAVVYGALPPRARHQQAQLFNDKNSEYDVLVASDAIGMGLNLNIRRIIFSESEKFDGIKKRPLLPTEIKQIAGRAGRFKSEFPQGYVTSLESKDIQFIEQCLNQSNISTERAGVFPTVEQIELFSRLDELKDVTFSHLLGQFFEFTKVDSLYFLEELETKITIAKLIDPYPMTIKDRFTFLLAPVKITSKTCIWYFESYAKLYSSRSSVPILVSRDEIDSKSQDLQFLEETYLVVDSYAWLSQHFPLQFTESKESLELLEYISEKVHHLLIEKKKEEKRRRKEMKKQKKLERRGKRSNKKYLDISDIDVDEEDY
ncbi:hypothetical protein CYY_005727 [Polysphondylium violaceum]|uniref:RNA helicase n=1 Tax=Polysphondylium violaceum TaxID=133409 RepID=A0A8J4URZ6_9MYCE|nr:hypothetical protein CYY_005727 [Polysphondylium violaceum]